MAEDLKLKVSARGYVKGSLTRSLKILNEDQPDPSFHCLTNKRDKLVKSFEEYEKLCQTILALDPSDKEDHETVEDNYIKVLSCLDERISKAKLPDQRPTTTTMKKLPPIHIKPFEGKFAEYVPFINLYMSMIHNDLSLDNVQKLYYLRSYLRDEPLDLIKNLPITPGNYLEALKLLTDRYDNKHKITADHINQLLDLKALGKSTAANLREFISSIRQQLAAIKNIDSNVKYWDSILLCILTRKLDTFTSRAYHLERDLDSEPTVEDFLKYLEKRALALENAEQSGQQSHSHQHTGSRVTAHATQPSQIAECAYCKSHLHKLYACQTFQMLPTDGRMMFIKDNKRCVLCLGTHSGKCRFHFKCAQCKVSHNTILHCNQPAAGTSVALTGHADNNVLLPTARVKVFGRDGTEYHIKALLDSGSQVSFVTSKVVQLLGLQPKESGINIIGITNTKSNVNAYIPLEVHSLRTPYKTTVKCHIVEQITCNLPQYKFNVSAFEIPTNVVLADEEFNVPGEVNMLIGADAFFQALLPSQTPMSLTPTSSESVRSASNSQTALRIVNTCFGHIVAGNLPQNLTRPTCNMVALKCEVSLNETFARFWEAEKVPEIFNEKSSEQELCEQIFQSTVKLNNNQFEVVIPLKLPLSDVNDALGDSFHFALKRFYNLEKKLHANPDLFVQYQNFTHEFLSLNHGHYVDIESYDLNKHAVYFLPHHAVINENSKTTKLRTVFDGSMQTNKKVSLNDLQLNGPVVQRDLFEIVQLFRLGKYTFATDIRRMFRNIRVNPAYSSLQNILWRDNPNEPVKCIRLDTVTYGLKSSSYLSTRCLEELANRFEKEYPLAASVLRNHSYVDDVVYSNNDYEATLNAKKQLRDVLKLGSFDTHKWLSNDRRILSDIPADQQYFGALELEKNDLSLKALGLQINIKDDQFIISSPEPFNEKIVTKRSILSYIGKIYDPMGFVSPIVVTAKAIMQKLWLEKTDWKESPSPHIQEEWIKFTTDLNNMKSMSLDRHIDISDGDIVQLIGFADASSTTGYGCCLYLRVVDSSGKTVRMHLLCSKSRINPVKKNGLTVPRLELNAALLLANLAVKTYNTLQHRININKVYLFSDSQIVLAWLNTEITKLQAYVGNRVNVIKEKTGEWSWLYVNTQENPADLISRGVQPSELGISMLWWKGPQFLHNCEYNFSNCEIVLPRDIPEVKSSSIAISHLVCQSLNPPEYVYKRLYDYSDINKIVRILAYMLRFLNNLHRKKEKLNTAFLQSSELRQALMLVVKNEQNIYFQTDIESLRSDQKAKGNLANLHPFLDELGLLRVGGRLHNASATFSRKHPVILPRGSIITSLIIRSEHERLLHAGPRLLLASLNQRFWLINGLAEIKKITHKCVACFRQKATVAKRLMGSLPASRVTETSRPFEKIGIDFAGPISVKCSRIRRSVVGKGYILVCVCFATKAVHLELASGLTTETFLACLRRLFSRRGVAFEIHCDNASTFKSARTQLTELYSLQSSQRHQEQVNQFAAQKGIAFHFIPSYSPTFGGLWEAAVKSTKYHLKRILQHNVLTYEQLNTVITEIEAVLNSRPLVPISSDPDDYCYLTPGHFIIGSALTMYPEKDLSDIPNNRLKFWQLCTSLKQSFWKIWHKYYLNVLQNRPKWRHDVCNVKLGSLVILKEDNSPPMSWPMARIVKLFTGHDGKIRAVEVRTANHKNQIRAIHKICVLPIE